MREQIHFKIYRILLSVFALVMPFSTPSLTHSDGAHFWGNITPTILGLFLLNWLLEADFKGKWQRIRKNKLTFPFIAAVGFYGIYLIGLIYSDNLDFGKTALLLKLPFLLCPLLIFTVNSAMWKPKMAQNLLFTFALGNLLALFVSLANSFFRCGGEISVDCFHYANASLFFHPSYVSMYYCFSFVTIFYFLINNQLHSWKKITAWFMFLLFPLEIVLLDSRTGQIAFAVVMLAFAAYIFVFNRRKSLRFVLYMSMLVGILTTTFFLLPSSRLLMNIHQMRMGKINTEQLNDDVASGRVNARAQIWVSAVEVIKEHPIFGTGTGDVKAAMVEKYVQQDFYLSQERRYNAHNQYLQVAATLGFIGLTVFFVFFGSIFWVGWRKRNLLLFLFGLIGLVNLCTESMFERQIGVMFFAFLFALLHYFAATDLLKEVDKSTP